MAALALPGHRRLQSLSEGRELSRCWPFDDPATGFNAFRKVMPTDYRKVLDAIARAEAEGRDVDEAIMESARG